MKRIFLIGYKNSGKTTTGKYLAKKLGFTFRDLDHMIEANDGRTVPEIFSNDGEQIFRKKERLALEQSFDLKGAIIATGGGAPRFFSNMSDKIKNGIVIYLRLDSETLLARLKIASKNRPIVKGKSTEELREYIKNMREQSEDIYNRSHITLDIKGLSTEKIVQVIMVELKLA